MLSNKRIILLIFIVTLIFSSQNCNSSTKTPQLKEWIYIYHKARISSHYLQEALLKNKLICMTGYTINKEGSIKIDRTDTWKKVMNLKDSSKSIIPLFTFASAKAGINLLSYKKLMARSALKIKSFSRKNNFKHIHFDFEHISPGYSKNLVTFISLIKKYNPQLIISMALFPQIDFKKKRSQLHDIEALSKHLDYIVIMTYDYHDATTSAGPVTDITWAEKNLRYFLQYNKSSKIYMGMPSYGYIWSKAKKATSISAKYGSYLKNKHGARRHHSGCVKIKTGKLKNKTIYFADKTTRFLLKKIALKYNCAGTALWRGGLEDQ